MPHLTTGEDVIQALRAQTDIAPYARMVGRWCWIEFPSKPSAEARAFLKDAGFHWNWERGAWQHPCGFHSAHAPYDPREKYQSVPLEDVAV